MNIIAQQEIDKRLLYNLLTRSSVFRGIVANHRGGGVPYDDPILQVILQSWFEDEKQQHIKEFENISLNDQTYNDIDITTH